MHMSLFASTVGRRLHFQFHQRYEVEREWMFVSTCDWLVNCPGWNQVLPKACWDWLMPWKGMIEPGKQTEKDFRKSLQYVKCQYVSCEELWSTYKYEDFSDFIMFFSLFSLSLVSF